jgi:hypothetical protein
MLAQYHEPWVENKGDKIIVEGGYLYFTFHQKLSKFGFRGHLGPKNTGAEKHVSITQVLITFKCLLILKNSST